VETLFDDIRAVIEASNGGEAAARDRAAAELVPGCGPAALWVTCGPGDVGEVLQLDPSCGERCVAESADQLARELSGKETCRLELQQGTATALVLGARFSANGNTRILGGLFRSLPGNPPDDDRSTVAFLAAAAAWAARHYNRANVRSSTRIDHLLAERNMLKASHAAALEAAIEERENRLREQEALHLQNQMILNSAGEGIVGLDLQGSAMFVNPAAARLLGYQVEELIGRAFHETVHHSAPDGTRYSRDQGAEFQLASAPSVSAMANHVFWRKDGTSFPVEYTCTPIREGDTISGVVITFRDISERRRLESQLRQAQKLESIGQLAAGIAHEINTPTQYIGDNARFLEDAFHNLSPLLVAIKRLGETHDAQAVIAQVGEIRAGLADADLDYLLEEIPRAIGQSLDGVERVATIVRSMKEFSHPGSEEKQAIDLNRAIESTLTVSRNEWKYVADVVTELDPSLPRVTCLPGDINQVILNLVVNAAHAIGDKLRGSTTEKGQIGVQTRHDGDWVEIRIRDTGTGIPQEIQGRVYDPFFTTKPVGRGTGQGLAIVHSVITERHRGTIRFETQPGQGTTFIIRLPVQDKAALESTRS
jgi:PAS domain S-box-containing protein